MGRVVQVMRLLPEYATSAERISHIDTDIRDAADAARKQLLDHAAKFTITGWSLDEESWAMSKVEGQNAILVRANLIREN